MEQHHTQPEALAASGGTSAPFSATRKELLAALAMYPLAWCYIRFFGDPLRFWIFALGFAAMAEWLLRGVRRSRESPVWLGCLTAVLLGLVLQDRLSPVYSFVWEPEQSRLFAHGFAVWWVLSRGGLLLEGETGHLLPLDALDGFVVFPFKNFFLRIRTLLASLWQLRGRRTKPATLAWSLAALVLALVLLREAALLLTAADSGFAALLAGWERLLRLRLFRDLDPGDFLLSLPVGAWLFGLLAGGAREDRGRLRQRAAAVTEKLGTLRRVPEALWTALLALFALLYLLFFFVQGRYLFGAFTRTLPEGFIVSQYARQGFFELCRVMAVNLLLLWLVARLSRRGVRENRPLLLACTLLLAESMLFAAVAFSKLALYISCFGFTPLRLQSCWGVSVLLAACLAALYSLWTGRKSLRRWAFFSAVTLALLHLLPF